MRLAKVVAEIFSGTHERQRKAWSLEAAEHGCGIA